MLDILSATQTQTSRATVPERSVISADFETFLRLLTTQMQNQDPLNPMESSEYATQLATFSGVEQQVQTNDLLRELRSGLSALSIGELGGWIGMQARAEMAVAYTGDPVTVQATPHALADRMELILRDLDGEIVGREPIVLSDAPFEWTGRDASGTPMPSGTYRLTVQSWADETLLEERNAMIRATIEEAQVLDGEVWVTMENGVSIPATDVQGLRSQ